MFTIVSKRELCPKTWEMVVSNPRLAKKAEPGHFVIVMADEQGERIPLTIADFDAERGTITLVIMAVGTSTEKLVRMNAGDNLFAMIGPLGHASELEQYGKVIMVAGGVGAAPVYPIARVLKAMGNHVIMIHGARSKNLLFWQDKLVEASSEYIVTTDDGSEGRKGLVTEPLRELLATDSTSDPRTINGVIAIGPAIMMKFCAETVRPFGVKTIASLNTIMIDGTGMCGGCRVSVGGKTMFTCVDGPEFDALAVDWDSTLSRQKIYCNEEKCSLEQYVKQVQNAECRV
jgi:ferredoxin--NADP+ reductase